MHTTQQIHSYEYEKQNQNGEITTKTLLSSIENLTQIKEIATTKSVYLHIISLLLELINERNNIIIILKKESTTIPSHYLKRVNICIWIHND